jgi:hypothetical protein
MLRQPVPVWIQTRPFASLQQNEILFVMLEADGQPIRLFCTEFSKASVQRSSICFTFIKCNFYVVDGICEETNFMGEVFRIDSSRSFLEVLIWDCT